MTPREMTEQAQRDGAALERARILGVVATPADAEELATALRAIHDGSERGELRRLLVRLWGPSPAVHVFTRDDGALPCGLVAGRPYYVASEEHAQRAIAQVLLGTSDLRGLAARESAPAHTGIAATWCPICGDCRCPYKHGFVDLGRTRDDPTCPLHGTKTTHPCPDQACDCHGPPSP